MPSYDPARLAIRNKLITAAYNALIRQANPCSKSHKKQSCLQYSRIESCLKTTVVSPTRIYDFAQKILLYSKLDMDFKITRVRNFDNTKNVFELCEIIESAFLKYKKIKELSERLHTSPMKSIVKKEVSEVVVQAPFQRDSSYREAELFSAEEYEEKRVNRGERITGRSI